MITATLYTDPGCPWAYSENPALRVIEWRYGDQLRWNLVMVGLTESSDQYAARGYTPLRGALGQLHFRDRYGMPFAAQPKPSLSATSPARRAPPKAAAAGAPAGLPRHRRGPPARPRRRVAGVPRAAAGELHQRARAR